jgi:type IV pilus assembly protein PilC
VNPLIFNWRGLKANEFVSGELEATSRDEAVFKLKAEGVIVTEIHGGLEDTGTKITKAQKPSFFTKKIKEQDLLLFTRKFATMIQAGLAIVPALNMLTRQSENPSLTEILEEVVSKVNAGIPLSKAIEVYPHLFDNVYISLIKAGEVGGSIDIFLKKIATNLAKKLKIIRGLKAALMYPIALLTVAVIVVSVMMVYVVPVFVEIFGAGGVELPLPTRIVMSISDFFRSYYMVGLIALIFFAFQSFKRTLKNNVEFRKKVHKNNLKLPVVGKLIENSIMARLSTVLSNLIAGGVGLIESIDIAKSAINNEYIKQALENVKRDVYSGRPLASSLRETKAFPETLCGFVEVGEETGKLNDMLETIAAFFEDEFDNSVSEFSQLLEPIMIVVLGILIGFILVAMYMPIFKMGSAVTG